MDQTPLRQPLPQLDLALTPTPLHRFPRLREAWGGPHVWVKRDDLTGFGLSGNKVRKLEFHLAAALEATADTVITCGAYQSNHCRATALACARLGLDVRLVLRTPDGAAPAKVGGNLLIDMLAGAAISYISVADWEHRDEIMAEDAARLAAAGRKAWVIPQGASDKLGMWGMSLGFRELVKQIPQEIGADVAAVVHAGSSGGTTSGFGWAADRTGFQSPLLALCISEPVESLMARVRPIWQSGVEAFGGEMPSPLLEHTDQYLTGGYAKVSEELMEVQTQATRLTGLLFDPTYTGKAIYGLRKEIAAGRFDDDDHVVFWHTGGGFGALVDRS
ncbi:MAG: pyridoxal-phosphate dependent enzyme [Acidimicrobiia bacterium]|nr:pyridoxal-phosphate dependent enzyme [Acidimicrobiia bacterium]MYK55859.1 pyridoxal-phosphate dependent enzyme [Acidimicrobiia bacterium]